MEGYSTSMDPDKPRTNVLATGSGWEMNTGAFAVKKSSIPLMQRWVDVFHEDPARFKYFQSGEQQGM